METKIDVNDPRIDVALETKPLQGVLTFIKEQPTCITPSRLVKLLKRFSEGKESGNLASILADFYRRRTQVFSQEVVATMIEYSYFFDDVFLSYMIQLALTYDEGNALKLIVKRFKDTWYIHIRHDYGLKARFTPEYLKSCLEKGMYQEVLTLAAMRFSLMPKLSAEDVENMKPYLFEVLTVGYNETNISSAQSYREERLERIKTLWTQELWNQEILLFDFRGILAVAMSDQKTALAMYEILPKNKKKGIQETLAYFIEQHPVPTLRFILKARVRVYTPAKKKMYDWIKEIMPEMTWYQRNQESTYGLFLAVIDKYRIKLSFNDFVEVLISACSGDIPDIENQYDGKPIMKQFFGNYYSEVTKHASYQYRSGITDSQKQKVLMDLFFWEYLPFTDIRQEEITLLNGYMDFYAEHYPLQVLKLAKKHEEICLSEDVKFSLFLKLAKNNPEEEKTEYHPVDFGISRISNDITVSQERFTVLLKKNISILYKISQLPQIQLPYFTIQDVPTEGCAWWTKHITLLMLIEKQKSFTFDDEVVNMLYSFANNPDLSYFLIRAWNTVSTSKDELIVLSKEISENGNKVLLIIHGLLLHNCIPIDENIVNQLVQVFSLSPTKEPIVKAIAKNLKHESLMAKLEEINIHSFLN